jgi:enterobactin synthetase component D
MQASVTHAHRSLQTELQRRLGPDLIAVSTGTDGDPEMLWPQERPLISAAVARRRAEFAAGRVAARIALCQLGWPECAIPAGEDRSPQWPSGVVGSISHTASVCVVVLGLEAHWTSIGIDIEAERAIPSELWPSICTDAELRYLMTMVESERDLAASRIFTAKEAYYKWQFRLTGRLLDFRDVEIEMRGEGFTPILKSANLNQMESPMSSLCGMWLCIDGWVLAWMATRRDQGAGKDARLHA